MFLEPIYALSYLLSSYSISLGISMGIISGNYSKFYFVKYDFFLFQVQSLLYMNTPSFRHLRVSSSQKNGFAVSVIREARTSQKQCDIFENFRDTRGQR